MKIIERLKTVKNSERVPKFSNFHFIPNLFKVSKFFDFWGENYREYHIFWDPKDGSDNNDGLSPDKPIKTHLRLREILDNWGGEQPVKILMKKGWYKFNVLKGCCVGNDHRAFIVIKQEGLNFEINFNYAVLEFFFKGCCHIFAPWHYQSVVLKNLIYVVSGRDKEHCAYPDGAIFEWGAGSGIYPNEMCIAKYNYVENPILRLQGIVVYDMLEYTNSTKGTIYNDDIKIYEHGKWIYSNYTPQIIGTPEFIDLNRVNYTLNDFLNEYVYPRYSERTLERNLFEGKEP